MTDILLQAKKFLQLVELRVFFTQKSPIFVKGGIDYKDCEIHNNLIFPTLYVIYDLDS